MDAHGVVSEVEVQDDADEHVVQMLDTIADLLSGHLDPDPGQRTYSREEIGRFGTIQLVLCPLH